MKIEFRFLKFGGGKPQTVTMTANEMTLTELRKFWEFEYFLNNLAGCTTRMHVSVEQSDDTK